MTLELVTGAPAARGRLAPLALMAGLAFALLACSERQTATSDAKPPPQLAAGGPVLANARTEIRARPDPGTPAVAWSLPGAPGVLEQSARSAGQTWWRVVFDEGQAGWLPASALAAVDRKRIRAFPGAEGFGAAARGGRGGRVIEVTNLRDHGPGSLRAALTADGRRTVVFRVGGTIRLRSQIRITEPYLTIAGQTAPGGGIAIRNDPADSEAPVVIETHDVVVRFLRVRPGPSEQPSCCLDALEVGRGARRVIIDHCSFSWAVDELLDAWYDAREITVQWSILAEALDRSSHQKGRHSRGMLFGGPDGGGDYSIHHNLFAHNAQRNPLLEPGRGVADIVNNVIYDPQSLVSHVEDTHGPVTVNYVGNYFKAGPDTNSPTLPNYALDAVPDAGGDGRFKLFVAGNYDELHRSDDALPEDAILEPADRGYLVDDRQPAPLVRTTSAARALEDVLAHAGATLPARDAVDLRIVHTVRGASGRLINDPAEVGGWPLLAPGTPPADADHDGMPDEWEVHHGLDPHDPGDGARDRDGDGYTNLEEYLDQLAGDLASANADQEPSMTD
jgi:pectate lyase